MANHVWLLINKNKRFKFEKDYEEFREDMTIKDGYTPTKEEQEMLNGLRKMSDIFGCEAYPYHPISDPDKKVFAEEIYDISLKTSKGEPIAAKLKSMGYSEIEDISGELWLAIDVYGPACGMILGETYEAL